MPRRVILERMATHLLEAASRSSKKAMGVIPLESKKAALPIEEGVNGEDRLCCPTRMPLSPEIQILWEMYPTASCSALMALMGLSW